MDTLKIVNGDLAVLGDGNTVRLTGAERIKQELTMWILEPLNTDVMYPGFGSRMGDFVGSPATEESLSMIRTEVIRIVDNYIAYQKRQLDICRESNAQDFLSAWSASDVIEKVEGVRVVAVADTCKIDVQLVTVGGSTINISEML